MRAVELLGRTTFDLFAIHPRHWHGQAFVGDVQRLDETIASVTFVYLADDSSGACVIAAPRQARVDDDIARFAARFDPRSVKRRTRRPSKAAFPAKAFDSSSVRLTADGLDRTVAVLVHDDLPLQIGRLEVTETSVAWVCAWNRTARDLLPLVEEVDRTMAEAFDVAVPPYPPPEWEEPEA